MTANNTCLASAPRSVKPRYGATAGAPFVGGFAGIALERPIDIERAFDADRVEIRLEPRLGVIAAEVAQLLEERPGRRRSWSRR